MLEVAQRILPAMPAADNKVIRPAWTEGLPRGYGTHPVLRYSVIPSAEHDTALLGKQRSAFIFHCGVIGEQPPLNSECQNWPYITPQDLYPGQFL